MLDVIFDIDGTLADATHRLHWIKDMAFWTNGSDGKPPRPNWDMFLSDELVAKDGYIPETWAIMSALVEAGARITFITGRPESQRDTTFQWLKGRERYLDLNYSRLYMRKTGDRRPSHEVKRDLLNQARKDGFKPTMVFEDRVDDTAMWRSEGLRCFQVAEGNY